MWAIASAAASRSISPRTSTASSSGSRSRVSAASGASCASTASASTGASAPAEMSSSTRRSWVDSSVARSISGRSASTGSGAGRSGVIRRSVSVAARDPARAAMMRTG